MSKEPAAIDQAAGGNDNLLFNASPTIGDHVTCGLLTTLEAVGLHPATATTTATATATTAAAPETCKAMVVVPEAQAVGG